MSLSQKAFRNIIELTFVHHHRGYFMRLLFSRATWTRLTFDHSKIKIGLYCTLLETNAELQPWSELLASNPSLSFWHLCSKGTMQPTNFSKPSGRGPDWVCDVTCECACICAHGDPGHAIVMCVHGRARGGGGGCERATVRVCVCAHGDPGRTTVTCVCGRACGDDCVRATVRACVCVYVGWGRH